MEHIDMIKYFAELECVDISFVSDGNAYLQCVNGWSEKYNPITDLALNCAARDKYRVSVIYKTQGVCIVKVGEFNDVIGSGGLDSKVPALVIECILKSRGLWK